MILKTFTLAMATAMAALLATPTAAIVGTDILNFALNLECLEAYAFLCLLYTTMC
jgi:hypothetical protein